jgi:hypothetical protein
VTPEEFNEKRKRDGERAIKLLGEIQQKAPEMRVCQIIAVALPFPHVTDRFYIENERLADALEKYLKSL